MIRVAVGAVANHFSVNFGAAPQRVLALFQNQNSRAFADDEPIPVFVERPARAFRFIVAGRKRLHGGKAASAPPAMTASCNPRRIRWNASPSAWVPEAHAEVGVQLIPFAP